MIRKLAALATVAASLAISAPAFATAYTFTSTGSFSSCGNCTVSPSSQISWGTGGPANTLASDFTTSAQSGSTTAGQPDQIGDLKWYNDSIQSTNPVTATFKIVLNFTVPTPGASSTITLPISITNTPDGDFCFYGFGCVDDTASGFTSPASFTVDGLVISNLTFVESGSGSFSNGVWSNPEYNTDYLKIYAVISDAPAAVPEPASIALLGAGLAGLGFAGRMRKKAKKAA